MEKGMGIFGREYEILYKNDTHAEGSVDRVMFEQMIKLDEDSVEYLYNSYTDLFTKYKAGDRPFLEDIISNLKSIEQSETVNNIISYCKEIVDNCDVQINDMIFGGTEEEIIKRGTDWCTDIARVTCVLFQIAGLASRILITANTKFAYCGHVVVEVFFDNKWGVVDPTNGIIFKSSDNTPVSAWELYNDVNIANRIFQNINTDRKDGFPPGEQYESVGIANYYVFDRKEYSYEISAINNYYAHILTH